MKPVSLMKKLLSNKIFVSTSLISIISVGAGLVNFFFQIVISRILGNEQYGVVYPLISLSGIMTLPAAALQLVMSREISVLVHEKRMSELKAYLRQMIILIAVFTAFICLVLLVSLPLLKSFFHIESSLSFIFIIMLVAITLLIVPLNSILQARELVGTYVANLILLTLSKFAVGVGLVIITHHYFGVLSALVISQLFSIFFLLYDTLRYQELKHAPLLAGKKGPFSTKVIIQTFLFALFSVGAYQFLTYIDSVLVRHFLPGESGIYSAVNIMGKASFFIATSISFVMLPQMAKDRDNMDKSNRKALIFLSIVLVLYALLLTVSSGFISKVVFGGKYLGMENILPLYAFMFLPYALITYMVNYYFISQKPFYTIALFAGAALEALGINFFHKDLMEVTLVVGVSGYTIFFALAIESFITAGKGKTNKIKGKDC